MAETERTELIDATKELTIITVRYDPQSGRTVIDLDGCDGLTAASMLRLALDRVEDDLEEAIFADEIDNQDVAEIDDEDD